MKLINLKWQQLILSLGCLLLIIACKNFLDAINEGIATLKSNGTYKQIYLKWFNIDPPQLPDSWALGIEKRQRGRVEGAEVL